MIRSGSLSTLSTKELPAPIPFGAFSRLSMPRKIYGTSPAVLAADSFWSFNSCAIFLCAAAIAF